MTRALTFAALLVLLVTSCAATLRVSATAPAQDNAGTCPAPVLTPTTGNSPMRLHFAWTGPVAGEDSVAAIPGELVVFSRLLPAGTYTVRAWASDAGGAGCDTIITRTIKNPPSRVGLLP